MKSPCCHYAEGVESINLGAVLFALLLLLWVAYALPRTANRRDVMGRARATDLTEASPDARDLSEAVRSRHSNREVNAAMNQDRLLLRPADPTRRPRFDAAPGVRMDPITERVRSRRVLKLTLGVLTLGVVALSALAVVGVITWWVPLIAVAGLAIYLVALRRAELERRSRARRAAALARAEEREKEETARDLPAVAEANTTVPGPAEAPVRRAPLEDTTDRAVTQVSRPGEWTPRPVPRPTYALRGEVDDLATRHAAHRASIRTRSVPLESEGVEELEATHESFAPAADLHLDEILERRRGA